jgi:hypothetical protein
MNPQSGTKRIIVLSLFTKVQTVIGAIFAAAVAFVKAAPNFHESAKDSNIVSERCSLELPSNTTLLTSMPLPLFFPAIGRPSLET